MEPKLIKVRTYKNFKDDDFLRDLRLADWSYFTKLENLDTACEIFNKNILSVAKKHAPYISLKVKGRLEAWVTDNFITSIKERNFLLKIAKRTKSIIDWNNLKEKGTM